MDTITRSGRSETVPYKTVSVGDGFQPSRDLRCRKHPNRPDPGGSHNAVGGHICPPYEGVHHWPFRRAGIFSLWNDRHRRSWLFVSLRYATPRRPRRSTAPVRPNAQRRTPGYRRRGQAPALRRCEDHRRPRPPLGGGCHEVTGGVPSVGSAALPCLPGHSLSHRRLAPLTAPSGREPGKGRPLQRKRTHP